MAIVSVLELDTIPDCKIGSSTPDDVVLPKRQRTVINVRDFGAKGDGQTDDSAAFQSALLVGEGNEVRVPAGIYLCKALFPKRDTIIRGQPGAVILGVSTSNNYLFGIGTNPSAKIRLLKSEPGSRNVTVTETRDFAVGDRIILSAGPFDGSGVEDGPIQWATVVAISTTGRLSLLEKNRDNLAAYGLPDQNEPCVYRLGPAPVSHIRVTGLTFRPSANFSGLYFHLGYSEEVEIDHCHFEGQGHGIFTGAKIRRLNFHHNISNGEAKFPGVAANPASMVESKIVYNEFRSAGLRRWGSNAIAAEVCCDDNEISYNLFAPHDSVTGGAIELSFNPRRNRIVGNRVYGLAGASGETLGIRTYANSHAKFTGGQTITNNIILNVRVPLHPSNASSATLIADNVFSTVNQPSPE